VHTLVCRVGANIIVAVDPCLEVALATRTAAAAYTSCVWRSTEVERTNAAFNHVVERRDTSLEALGSRVRVGQWMVRLGRVQELRKVTLR
jgi:hypothetical protein